MNKRVKLSIFIYLIIIIIIILIKPPHIYNNNGTLKLFGTGEYNTLLPLWMIILLAGFFSYYLTHVILHISSFKIRIG